MGDGTRLAIAIAVLFLAGVAFFFAFHPSGVAGATNPDNALEWLMNEFQQTAGVTATNPPSDAGAGSSPSADQPGGQPEKSTVPPQTKDIGTSGGF
jgi:hypothetical protein